MTKIKELKNKTVMLFMVFMLILNFSAWTLVTIKTEKTLEEVNDGLRSCVVKNG